MNRIDFSLIIPVYNVGDFLRPCLESIRCQSGNWECILVNDGSTDGSGKVCDELTAADSRFRVFHQENAGVSSARNRGMAQASGEWLWFVDADDIIHPNSLKILGEQISKTTVDFIYFDFLYGKEVSFNGVKIPENLSIKLISERVPEMSPWRCIFRRKISEHIRFEDYIVGEDLLFCAKVSEQASSIGYIPVQLYGYVKRESSVMHSASFRKTRDSILWMRQILQFYNTCKKPYYKQLEKSRWNRFFFGTAREIMRHDSAMQTKLTEIWFREIAASRTLKTPLNILLLRMIYLRFFRFSFVKKNAIRINSFLFFSYSNIKTFLRKR